MKLKKANALFGLLTILLLLVHAGYQMIAYVKFLYNPFVTKLLSYLVLGALLIHMVLGMSILMFAHDGSDLGKYPRQNRAVILQRASAIGILVFVFGHMKAYDILTSHFGGHFSLVLALLLQTLFFGSAFLHVGISFSRALITLGLLSSPEKKKILDWVVWVLCGIAFVVILIIMAKTYGMLWGMAS